VPTAGLIAVHLKGIYVCVYIHRVVSSGMLRRVALCKNRRFGRTEHLHHQGDNILCISSQRASVDSYGYVPSSSISVTMMMEAVSSSETSVLTRATRRNISEDSVLHSHRRENLKSYIYIYIYM
jgi:hypothetical protein